VIADDDERLLFGIGHIANRLNIDDVVIRNFFLLPAFLRETGLPFGFAGATSMPLSPFQVPIRCCRDQNQLSWT